MIIPRDPAERQQFYADITRQCLASRVERFEFYRMCRNYYLFGTADESGAAYNKVQSTVENLASMLYSPEGIKFSIELGTTADEDDIFKAVPLSAEVAEQWRMSGTHMRFGLAVNWAQVFGSVLLKVQWRRGIARTYLCEPHQFGVLREDVMDLSDQEAFAMVYTTTRTQLASDLQGNPRRSSILARIGQKTVGGRSGLSDGMSRLLLTNPIGGVPGSIAQHSGVGGGGVDNGLSGGQASYSYAARVEADLVDMVDLYVWDDETEDYQVVTQAAGDVVVYDRPQRVVGVKGMPHFVVVRANNNLYDYFWGDSYVARLAWLQDWRSEDVQNIRLLQSKQADPPISATGMTGIAEEKLLALRSAGGRFSAPTVTAKVEMHPPKMPENIFSTIQQIDSMFDDVAGIGHILQGKGESGVRSKGQADLMARLGSSRPKSKALVIEEAAESVATLMLRSIQEHSDQRFVATPPDAKPVVFAAAQFTKDYEVKVDAHSSSPIYIEDRKHDAIDLLQAHVIDREAFLELFAPPNLQVLKKRLTVIERKEALAAQAKAKAEAEQAKGGSS